MICERSSGSRSVETVVTVYWTVGTVTVEMIVAASRVKVQESWYRSERERSKRKAKRAQRRATSTAPTDHCSTESGKQRRLLSQQELSANP